MKGHSWILILLAGNFFKKPELDIAFKHILWIVANKGYFLSLFMAYVLICLLQCIIL